MTNKLSSSVEHNEELHCGLTSQEIHEWLSGLQNGTFPMRLLTKWYISDKENWFADRLEFKEKNVHYRKLVQSERELIQKLPAVLSEKERLYIRNERWEKSDRLKKYTEEWKLIGHFNRIVDIWCGDGKTLSALIKHIYAKHSEILWKGKITLLDASWLAVQYASQLFPAYPKEAIVGDVFDPFLSLSGSQKTLFTSLGRGYGNMSEDQRKLLRIKIWNEGKLLLSVFKTPQTEQAKKNRLKAYWADPDGDNKQWYEAAKKQLRNMMKVLGFSPTQREQCDFIVKEGEENNDGVQQWHMWFMPHESMAITHEGVEHTYDKDVFYQVYHSDTFSRKYANVSAKKYGRGHDKVSAIRENDESMVIAIELQKEKYQYLKRKIKRGLFVALVLLWWQKLKKVTRDYALNAPVVSEAQKENLEQVIWSNGTYNVKQIEHYQSLLKKTVDLYYAGYNWGWNENLDLRGIDPISKNDRDNYLVPAITNVLAGLPYCERNGMPCDTFPEHDLYTIALQVAEKNPALFHGGAIEKSKSRFLQGYDTRNEDFTRLASQEIKQYIYNLVKDIPLTDYNTMLEALDKKCPEAPWHRTYAKSGGITYFGAIHTPYDLRIGKEDPKQVIEGNFLLFIPWPDDIAKYKTRDDIITFSQKEAARMGEFRDSFDHIISGASEGY